MDNRISSPEQLAGFATELTDEEIGQVGVIIMTLQHKYSHLANTAENLDKLRDEAVTRCAEVGILVTLDPTPCFYGEPPTVDIVGKVSGHSDQRYGFDHEKKQYEVRKATELGEEYRGQKEQYNVRKKNG